eukprot:5092394-Alexandrium_andersonii.AAC.1
MEGFPSHSHNRPGWLRRTTDRRGQATSSGEHSTRSSQHRSQTAGMDTSATSMAHKHFTRAADKIVLRGSMHLSQLQSSGLSGSKNLTPADLFILGSSTIAPPAMLLRNSE